MVGQLRDVTGHASATEGRESGGQTAISVSAYLPTDRACGREFTKACHLLVDRAFRKTFCSEVRGQLSIELMPPKQRSTPYQPSHGLDYAVRPSERSSCKVRSGSSLVISAEFCVYFG